MNILLISEYIRRIAPKDIANFATSQGITLTEQELQSIYKHVKEDYKVFLTGNPLPILNQLKEEVRPSTYNKVVELYNQYKNKF